MADCKVAFAELVHDQILVYKKKYGVVDTHNHYIHLQFVYYNGRNTHPDLSNYCAIVDKFFTDCLVTEGVIPDDTVDTVREVTYRYGCYDKDNDHIEIYLYLQEPKHDT